MKKVFLIFVLFVLTSPVLATQALNLRHLVEQKSAQYRELNQYYKNLLSSVRAGNEKLFCQEVYRQVQALTLIYADDMVLIKTLRTSNNVDHLEFATHLEENSFSPLFSSLSHRELCDHNRREDILELTTGIEYHVMNIDYLSMTNLLFLGTLPL